MDPSPANSDWPNRESRAKDVFTGKTRIVTGRCQDCEWKAAAMLQVR